MSEDDVKTEAVVDKSDTLDIGSLFRGTTTLTFVVEIVTGVMMIGSIVAFVIGQSGLIESIDFDLAVFLLLLGSMITLLFFLGTIGFFVRMNRRIAGVAIWQGASTVDMRSPKVKTVIIIYGLAVGLLLIMGMYGFYLAWKYYLSAMAETSLSIFMFSFSLGVFLLAFLIQLIVIAIGRTAGSMIRKVLADYVE